MPKQTQNEPKGYDNLAYKVEVDDDGKVVVRNVEEDKTVARPTWNNSVEFLMSCIAVSVGFGNIWRFPFTAYENGGGIFLIPYVILLCLVGRPIYLFEMIIGQFSASSPVKVWRLCPAFSGLGCAQLCSITAVLSYYSSLMALTLFFLIASFSAELPWSKCREEWGDQCVDSSTKKYGAIGDNFADVAINSTSLNQLSLLTQSEGHRSSAELYFLKVVLHERDSISNGIGYPDAKLALCLFGSWFTICLVTFRGIKSSGRASYFLALFPYVILIALLCRAVTLEGSINGILFFITPVWSKLLEPKVWYAAVTQCFFSLSVCFGSIITYSSYNDFRHNIYKDVIIVTTLDTVTSMIAGCTIFGILGNLAYEMGIDDIGKVVKSGAGLAFISYPDAIAKFSYLPNLFAILFFVMMFVLGVGSSVGMASGIVAIIKERFPARKTWQVVVPTCMAGFLISSVYVTPGGQYVLTLVDYYGASFVVFILAFFEIVVVTWVYGLENFLDDLEFMLNKKPSIYWKVCWFFVTPLTLIAIFIYTIVTLSPLMYGEREYPSSAHVVGWMLLSFAILQIPFWMLMEFWKHRSFPLSQMFRRSFEPSSDWGPQNSEDKRNWHLFREERAQQRGLRKQSLWAQKLCILLGKKPK